MPESDRPLCNFAPDCHYYQRREATPSATVLKKVYCHGDPGRCEIRSRRLAGKSIPENMLPDGSVEG